MAEDIFKEKTSEFLLQMATKGGPLYEKWVTVRNIKIREHIEKEKAFKPERASV